MQSQAHIRFLESVNKAELQAEENYNNQQYAIINHKWQQSKKQSKSQARELQEADRFSYLLPKISTPAPNYYQRVNYYQSKRPVRTEYVPEVPKITTNKQSEIYLNRSSITPVQKINCTDRFPLNSLKLWAQSIDAKKKKIQPKLILFQSKSVNYYE